MAKKATKTATKKARVSIDETRKIKAMKGQEGHFYKGFPRRLAYELLVKAKAQTMIVKTFLDKIEKLPGVKDRAQARGIVAKMVNKPGDDGVRNGQVAHFV